MIIKGATAVAEFKGIKVHPRAPKEMRAESVAISNTENTPEIVRSNTPTISNMAINMAGVKVAPSSWLATANCSPNGTDPVI